MKKFALPTILFIALFQLCPPIFADGGTLDVQAIGENGEIIHGIYFDNVYFSMLFIFFSWLSISIPVIFKEIPRAFRWISFLSGGWWIAGASFEIANIAEPLKTYNTPEMQDQYGYYLFAFIIGTTFIILNEIWNKQEQQ